MFFGHPDFRVKETAIPEPAILKPRLKAWFDKFSKVRTSTFAVQSVLDSSPLLPDRQPCRFQTEHGADTQSPDAAPGTRLLQRPCQRSGWFLVSAAAAIPSCLTSDRRASCCMLPVVVRGRVWAGEDHAVDVPARERIPRLAICEQQHAHERYHRAFGDDSALVPLQRKSFLHGLVDRNYLIACKQQFVLSVRYRRLSARWTPGYARTFRLTSFGCSLT